LLSSSDISSLGLKDQKEDIRPGLGRECGYHYSAFIGSLGVNIWDELGVTEIRDRSQLTPLSIGKHEAIRGVSPGGVCVIAIKLSDTSRVDVGASTAGDEKKGCELAQPAAEAVEKNLPPS
jgi:hypothetical protein